jgi:hypothetical protein
MVRTGDVFRMGCVFLLVILAEAGIQRRRCIGLSLLNQDHVA